jgi:hypothetical protein
MRQQQQTHKSYKIKLNAKTQLERVLENHKGNGFAHIIARVPVRMNKTDNPFFGILFKVSDLLINYGFHYANSLDNQAKREDKQIDFEVKPRTWGTRIKGTPLVEHTKKDGSYHLYLEAKVEQTNSTKYELEDGTPVQREDFEQFLPKRKESTTQDGLTKKIILRDYALANIQTFRGDGVEIIRQHDKELVAV